MASCQRDEIVTPTPFKTRSDVPFAIVGDQCQQTCVISTSIRPFRAAAMSSDSVGVIIDLGSVEVAADAGSAVSLSMELDNTFGSSPLLSTLGLIVSVDGASTRFSYAELLRGAEVYHFTRPETVVITYGLPRERGGVAPQRVRLVQNLNSQSRVISSRRPWVSKSEMAVTEEPVGPVTQPGNYGGVDVN
jgi:hypothetical protein